MKKKLVSTMLSVALASSVFTGIDLTVADAESWTPNMTGTPQYMTEERQMEQLDRGLIAVYRTADGRSVMQQEAGVYLSWRLLGDESLEDQAFDIYKNGEKIATTGAHDATNYIDTTGTINDKYKVVKAGASADEVVAEKEAAPQTNYTAKGNEVGNGNSLQNSFTYVDIPISRPDPVERMGDGKLSYYYSYDSSHEGGANDASVGDLDGDGDYEIILKWDPTDSKDSAGSDFTGRVYIDAYQIDPENEGPMWRIDLGQNVTAGAHYTQFMVFDFDGDGRSEVAMQTAPGSKDGQGNYVSEVGDTEEIRNVDNEASYVGTSGRSKGKNLGPEYYTIFDGETGAALCTTAAIPLNTSKYWGDDTGRYNRCMRYLAGVAYLDGVRPSLIECRGYYNRAVIRAYTFDGAALSLQWEYNSGGEGLYGQGNHNLSIADIDNDGCDEIVYGSAALDNDGKTVLGNTGYGHGDALHVSDFNNDGIQEAFSVKEEDYRDHGGNFRVAGTGEDLFNLTGANDDVGRGVMDNIDDDYAASHPNALAMGWTSAHPDTYDLNGDNVNTKPASAGSGSFDNFLIYWDGDLGRELLDANIIQKYDADTGITKRFYGPSDGYTLVGGATNNFTKRSPSLVADIWGDWREEVILPVNKGSDTAQAYLRIYTSTIPTDYRLTTLMHDSQYRCSVAWQNVGYNQPTHQSYYIGSAALAKSGGETMNYLAPATLFTKVGYDIDTVHVTGVSLSETSVRVEKGSTHTITAQLEPENATRKGITWSSSDTSVATVIGGTITGVEPGTATITARTRDGGYTATCEVEVWSTPVTGVSVSEDVTIGVGSSKRISAEVQPSDASDKDIEWTSSNTSIATVDENGVVTGVTAGAVLITATTDEGGFTDSCMVNVTPLKETDVTGDDVFKTDNTDAETMLIATETSAILSQNDASVGGNFYRTFDKFTDNKAVLSFRFMTGGQENVGDNATDEDKWNWDGHEYSFYLSLLGENDQNILTLSQAYRTKGENLISNIEGSGENVLANDWTTVVDGIGQVQGSSKRWIVEIEFDYDNDTAFATLTGTDSSWTAVNAQYTREFDLNGLSLEKISYHTTKDGEGGITVSPQLSDLSYTRLTPMDGATTAVYEKGTAWYNAWSNDDIADWTQTGTETASLQVDANAGDNGRLYYNPTKPSTSYNAQKTFDISDNAIVTYSVDWHFGSATNRFANFEYIQFGSNIRLGWTSKSGYYYVLASTDAGNSYIGHTGEDTAEAVSQDQAIFAGENTTYTKHIQVIYNAANNTIESLTFDGNTVDVFNNYKLPEGAAMDSISFGFQRGGSTEEWGYPNGLESLLVSEFVEGAVPERPTPAPTPTPEPTPGPTLTPVEHDVTDFELYSQSRMTASDAEGEENTVTFTNASNANNGFGGAYVDISDYVDGETNYTVEYDSYVASTSRTRIALVDVSQRPDGSNKNTYSTAGVAIVHGVVDGSSYAVNNDKTVGNAPTARDAWVHTTITVDTEHKTLSYSIADQYGSVLLSGDDMSYLDSGLETINGIEFFDTINDSVGYMKNIKVITYRDPSEPTEEPSETPTEAVTEEPSETPTETVTEEPSESPTETVTQEPTAAPSENPAEGLEIEEPVLAEGVVSITVSNISDEVKSVKLLVASYDSEGRLIGLSLSEDAEVSPDGTVTVEAGAPTEVNYKVMLWNGLASNVPLMTPVTELAEE